MYKFNKRDEWLKIKLIGIDVFLKIRSIMPMPLDNGINRCALKKTTVICKRTWQPFYTKSVWKNTNLDDERRNDLTAVAFDTW